MAEDKFEQREVNYRQWLPWTQIFRGFSVARDPKKLLLAAAGIVVMAFGWWLLATIFYTQVAGLAGRLPNRQLSIQRQHGPASA